MEKNMWKKYVTALMVLFMLPSAVYAEDGFSGFTGVRSNYM
ncbi:uncharacterized protein METZ01_LOCUS295771, partial [marine metagenome]